MNPAPEQAEADRMAQRAALPCPACGYDLRGSPDLQCPECGRRWSRAKLRIEQGVQQEPSFFSIGRRMLFSPGAFWSTDARAISPRSWRFHVFFHAIGGALAGASVLALDLWIDEQWPLWGLLLVWPMLVLAGAVFFGAIHAFHAAVCRVAMHRRKHGVEGDGWAVASAAAAGGVLWQPLAALAMIQSNTATSTLTTSLAAVLAPASALIGAAMCLAAGHAAARLALARGMSAEPAGLAALLCGLLNPGTAWLLWYFWQPAATPWEGVGMSNVVIVISILLQLLAAVLALRLIAVTGRRTAWALIAAAVVLMAIRRMTTLIIGLQNPAKAPDLPVECVALAISLLMVCGIARIGPIFRRAREVNESLQREQTEVQAHVRARTAELERLTAEFRDIYENVPCGHHSVDADNVIVRINDTELGWLGYARDELVGKKRYFDLIAAESRKAAEARFEEFKACGSVRDMETELVRADGTRLPVVINATAIRGADGRFVMSRSTVFDNSQRRGVEEKLRESEERFRQLAEHIDEVFWLERWPAMKLEYVSPAYERVWGRTCEAIYKNQRDWIEAIHADDREHVTRVFVEGAARGNFDVDYRIVRPDGSIRWIHDRGFPVRNAAGEVYRIAGIAEDITVRKESEESLRESRDLLKAILHGTSDAVFLKDREGRYRVSNPVVERVTGRSGEQLHGLTDHDLFDADTIRMHVETDRRVLASGIAETFEQPMTVDGEPRIFQTTKTAWRNVMNEIAGVIGVARDVTDLRRAEEKLRQAERLVTTGTMAAGIAHEVNNPVGIMLLAAQTGLALCDKPTPPEAFQPLFRSIEDHATRCGRIVKSLLWFARHVRTEQQPCDVNQVVVRAVELMGRLAEEHAAPVMIECADGLPAVMGNPVELEHAVANLISNAVQAGGAGNRVTVRTRADGDRVRVEVEDRGAGMTDAQRARMFEPFFTTRQSQGGMGLGLSVVHGIVQLHQGRIDVSSRVGAGTTMAIDLPALLGANAERGEGEP